MDYQLVIVRGRSAAQVLQLADGVTTVGRHDDCQLRIKSSQVSRKHCELFEKKGLLLVKDLASANGTFVNGQKVDGQRVLEPGDELTIGQVKLRVERKAGAAAAAAPTAQPMDTAVVSPATEPAGAAEDDFELEFDDMGESTPTVHEAAGTPGGDLDIDDLLNEPPPAAALTPTPAPAPSSTPTPAPEPAAPPPKDSADDAVADFLLDIKFDEEDR